VTVAIARRIAIALGLVLAAATAGCGSSSASDKSAVTRLVDDFAAAHDRRACDLLSPLGLADVYGAGNATQGRAKCVAASPRFRSGPVTIIQVKFHGSGNSTVISRNPQTGRHYTVTASKYGSHWLIDRITSP